VIDLEAARAWLREHEVPVEIDDPDVLDRAVQVVVAPGGEAP
jgi:hypothetical protein